MLLFLDDWKHYPNAIIDTTTKNESFIRLSALYRQMGVNNNAFPLALLNPDLQGVDPHDPNLTKEQMLAIIIECKLNFMYYLREVVIVPGSTKDIRIRFKANRANISMAWLYFNHIANVLIQPRQTGKSFSIDELAIYLLEIRCQGVDINLLTKDDTLRSSNLRRLKKIDEELPFYLRRRTKYDIGNTEELTVKALDNVYRGHLPNKSPKAAELVGRGLTSPTTLIDEASFIANVEIILAAALPAGTAARNLAKLKGEPYGNIFSTTAGKLDDPDGAFIYGLLTRSAYFDEKFFDCINIEDLEKTIRKHSPGGELRVNSTFNHRQLGYTDEWLEEAIENSTAKGDAVDRDFFNRWTSGSQTSPLSVQILTMIRESEKPSLHSELYSYGYIMRWYIPENQILSYMNNNSTVAALDSSDAAGGDDISLTIRCVKTGEVLAVGVFNETNLITFCEWLVFLLETYSLMTLIPERRSTGSTIIDYLLIMLPAKNIDPFARIFNRVVQEKDEFPERFEMINKPMYMRDRDLVVKFKKYFGFATSAVGATSRTELYGNTLASAAKITGDKVYDKPLIDQILSLVVRNGRVDHPVGAKDDMCITWLLSYWLLSKGRNLSFYNIDTREVLAKNKTNNEINSPMAYYNRDYDNRIRSEVEKLVSMLKYEKDPYLSKRIERELIVAADKLNSDDKATLSVDELINNINKSKQFSNNFSRY